MKWTILGSGGCTVIPKPLCQCRVCREAKEKGIPYARSGPSAFLRSFVKKIVVDKEKARLYYRPPVPPDGRRMEEVRVLPIDTPSGAEGTRTPDFLLAKEALSRLSYSPTCRYYSNKANP
jgi:hypothetical protein